MGKINKYVFLILIIIYRYIKIGWAGENFPAHSYPAIIGRPMLRYDQKIEGVELKVTKIILNTLNISFYL